MIKIVNLEDSDDIEETDILNWSEQHNLAIKYYNGKQKVTEEKFRAYLDKHKLKENTTEKNVKVLELEMHLIYMAISILM